MDNAIGKIRSGMAEIIIMSMLSKEDLYGYQIKKELDERSDGVFDLPVTVVYPILRQLENNGFIASYPVKAGVRRIRQYYRMEAAGRKVLDSALKQLEALTVSAKDMIRSKRTAAPVSEDDENE